MANRNYQRGTYREYKLMKELEEKGWRCIRSAGSHGPVDIVAMKQGIVQCFQVKKKGQYLTKKEKEEMERWIDTTFFNIQVRMM